MYKPCILVLVWRAQQLCDRLQAVRCFPYGCAAKAAWVAAVNSPELVYVSGRERQPGEINGKSGNLNNALGLIYPAEVDIPLDEVRITPAYAGLAVQEERRR